MGSDPFAIDISAPPVYTLPITLARRAGEGFMSFNALVKNAILWPFNLLYRISPEANARLLYRLKTGQRLDLRAPRTYNEKLQWIKLYDRNPLMPLCVDKFTVRRYVEDKGLGELLNGLLWEGFDPGQIPFDALPDRFAIKVTHGSGFNILCRDKASLDRAAAVRRLRRWLRARYLPCYGEWFYGQVRPRVIVEPLLTNGDGDEGLDDYKVYCFNGEPRYISVDAGRQTGRHCKDIYDAQWRLQRGYEMAYPCGGQPIPPPPCLDRLLECARVLSGDFLHARVDFYVVGGQPVFGEITFANSAGFGRVQPREFALKMGEYLKLPIDA